MAPITAHAWGAEGHQIVAQIARAYLTPAVLTKVDALLAGDTSNPLTPHDMASEAVWADVYRGAGHKETVQWHFVNIELDKPDLASACFNFPSLGGRAASEGPADDCITDKITEFAKALSNPATSPQERITALRYVLHFVGDIHQPLHAADNHDRGGNCVQLALGGPRTQNLHSYWDTGVVEALGTDPVATSRRLVAAIKPEQAKLWSSGGPKAWAAESFDVARRSVYTIGSKPGCDGGQGPIPLPAGYADAAKVVVTEQLQKAGIRLALVLNSAFS
jgi:hypothetical protein